MRLKNFCLIGHPLGHSISPELHMKLFKLSHIEASYSLNEIEPENFEQSLDSLKKLDGFNITIPYKQRILPFLDEIESRAKRFGAVNTVKCENGKLKGFNTDIEGFLRALDSAGIKLQGRVLLCGAGGAAHMMGCAALEHGCSLTIATRTVDKAKHFTHDLGVLFPDSDLSAASLSDIRGEFDLILNGTPAGMYPNVDGCPVDISVAKSAGAVFDAVYNPCDTTLLKAARSAGAKVQGGIPMLVWQAAAAQEIWTGAHFDENDILPLCREMETLVSLRYDNGGKR